MFIEGKTLFNAFIKSQSLAFLLGNSVPLSMNKWSHSLTRLLFKTTTPSSADNFMQVSFGRVVR